MVSESPYFVDIHFRVPVITRGENKNFVPSPNHFLYNVTRVDLATPAVAHTGGYVKYLHTITIQVPFNLI